MSTFWQGTCDTAKLITVFCATTALNLGTDITLISVPFPALLLITEKRIRIAISIVFGLAGIVVVVSTIRAILIAKDATKASKLIVIFSNVEVTTGVIISALPEVSRGFRRAYLQSSGIRSFATWTPAYGQRTQQTTNGAILLTTDNRKHGVVSQRVEGSRDGIGNIKVESAEEQHYSSSEQSI